ncbi:MAG TPA: hypothetical protein VM889_06220 [Candidatus Thermoplasmatota archaeon]|nr:hypothetical protein [Candidatus Thermoplasmatota archaeon]
MAASRPKLAFALAAGLGALALVAAALHFYAAPPTSKVVLCPFEDAGCASPRDAGWEGQSVAGIALGRLKVEGDEHFRFVTPVAEFREGEYTIDAANRTISMLAFPGALPPSYVSALEIVKEGEPRRLAVFSGVAWMTTAPRWSETLPKAPFDLALSPDLLRLGRHQAACTTEILEGPEAQTTFSGIGAIISGHRARLGGDGADCPTATIALESLGSFAALR